MKFIYYKVINFIIKLRK